MRSLAKLAMAEPSRTRRHLLAGAAVVAVAGGVFVGGRSALSRLSRAQSDHITILDAQLQQRNDRWWFDYRAGIDLPTDIRLGLESGVPLQFIVSLQVENPTRFWRDEVLLLARHRIRLVYYELTRHYRVQFVDSDRSVNKRSLLSALDELGTLQMMDVTSSVRNSKTLADSTQSRVATLSISLDQRALPLPLQPVFSSDWRLASEEFVWHLS